MQQQTNCVDSGLFIIAFATSLGHIENPVRRVSDTTKLRQHLVSCLEAGKMSVFYLIVQMKKNASKQQVMLVKPTVNAKYHVKTMI